MMKRMMWWKVAENYCNKQIVGLLLVLLQRGNKNQARHKRVSRYYPPSLHPFGPSRMEFHSAPNLPKNETIAESLQVRQKIGESNWLQSSSFLRQFCRKERATRTWIPREQIQRIPILRDHAEYSIKIAKVHCFQIFHHIVSDREVIMEMMMKMMMMMMGMKERRDVSIQFYRSSSWWSLESGKMIKEVVRTADRLGQPHNHPPPPQHHPPPLDHNKCLNHHRKSHQSSSPRKTWIKPSTGMRDNNQLKETRGSVAGSGDLFFRHPHHHHHHHPRHRDSRNFIQASRVKFFS